MIFISRKGAGNFDASAGSADRWSAVIRSICRRSGTKIICTLVTARNQHAGADDRTIPRQRNLEGG
jgi:hypothetical protein